jgi:ribosomal protein S18 acetylase RimI-like enzyme
MASLLAARADTAAELTRVATAIPMLRDFRQSDVAHVDRVALTAFAEFRSAYSDWSAMSAAVSATSALASVGELIVAELDGALVGAVAYIAPGRPKPDFFDASWPIVRMLVVDPDFRGRGVGRALLEECLNRARRDGSAVLGLHTSPIMTTALSMYRKMGFKKQRDAPAIYGVPSAVYVMRLER